MDVAQKTLEDRAREMGLQDAVNIVRKDRAVGVVPNGVVLTREQLDEFALSAQRQLNAHQKHLHRRAHPNSPITPQPYYNNTIPFCAFNGGSDVWVDVGNKLIGVQILQQFLNTKGEETLHVGDQFLSTGNDISTRTACCTVWITSPEETAEVLVNLCELLDEKRR